MTCNEQYEMRVETMDDMSLDGMSRLVRGFINTVHPESQILYGIQPDYPSVSKATVVGMPCDQIKVAATAADTAAADADN